MPRAGWATAVLLVTVGGLPSAVAQPLAPLAPVGGPPAPAAAAGTRPPAVLGAPVAVPSGESVRSAAELSPASSSASPTVIPAGRDVPAPPGPSPQRAATLAAPTGSAKVAARVIEAPARPSAAEPPADPMTDLLARRARDRDRPPPERSSEKFGEKLEGFWDACREKFRSDHAFDGFISPVTNPFLFEDPRSLTEVRPVFIYQKVPSAQADLQGGSLTYFGVQGRLAITERWSFVIHKLGGLSVNPSGASPIDGETGFAELWFGPKYTFIRNELSGSLLAGGLQFQLPVGSSGVFQNTGSLSLVPYATYGQNLFPNLRIGSLNALANTGYAFSTTRERSDYYFLNGHLDLDVGNWHRIYPLAELNWLLYTTNGTSVPIGSEGRDLINFGAQAKGKGLLTGALGARLKITESAQLGAAFELPLAGPKDLFRYRFTVDFILRY
jgi:hypothetical protein